MRSPALRLFAGGFSYRFKRKPMGLLYNLSLYYWLAGLIALPEKAYFISSTAVAWGVCCEHVCCQRVGWLLAISLSPTTWTSLSNASPLAFTVYTVFHHDWTWNYSQIVHLIANCANLLLGMTMLLCNAASCQNECIIWMLCCVMCEKK